ncbi:Serine/threonine protein kinase [Actinomadura madurae]|uniref:Serine/threonine protein kinase n=1 Tax=Actinomadura madurae TaxID=1993 RepID=A0A1I5MGJ0_9ACTN|nr:hypothetical protein [Actinomadura madurae]SFP08633.1 Serine/threonine protein kinase [Actinomadura madurae]
MNGDSFFSATSYIASFQKPERYLRDPELRAGRVERPHGGPLRPMDGGGFASVFRVVSADGRKSWAVKCFLRPTAELSDRYRAIEARLADVGDYWKVGFGYDPEGLFHLPENRWVPVLKMTWVNGTRLIPWLEDRLGDAAALRRMALEFTNVIGSLERAGIAHGDLQHGNIIVVAGDRIRLVDYDGMYVPALKGFRMPECGVPHYQPPDRGERGYFGPAADRFSARVIRLGIRAVAADPGLWDRLHETDGEYLILRNTDFAEPERSEALRLLRGSGDPWVRAETAQLLRDLTTDPELIPSLSPLDLAGPVPRVAGLPVWMRTAGQQVPWTPASPDVTAADGTPVFQDVPGTAAPGGPATEHGVEHGIEHGAGRPAAESPVQEPEATPLPVDPLADDTGEHLRHGYTVGGTPAKSSGGGGVAVAVCLIAAVVILVLFLIF